MKTKFTFLFTILFVLVSINTSAAVRYVNEKGTGSLAVNAVSWNAASPDFGAVLNASVAGDEVWVATGEYMPAAGQSYSLIEGVKVYGGFVGTETDRTQRNWKTNQTVLQGSGGVSIFRNVGTVSDPLTPATVLDGFVLLGGDDASTGAKAGGGAMWNTYASITISNCVFTDNEARIQGAAICNTNYSHAIITNCSFTNNSVRAHSGGAVFNGMGSEPVFTNCTFSKNYSPLNGGAIYNYNGWGLKGHPKFINCLFSENEVGSSAAAILNGTGTEAGSETIVDIINCTFSGNKAIVEETGLGGAIIIGLPTGQTCTVNMYNSIVFGNTAPISPNIALQSAGLLLAEYSLIEGMDSDPSYADAANHNLLGGTTTAANIFNDIAAGDFSAKTNSITVNAGMNILNEEALDLVGNPRVFETTIDLGAYELQVPKGPSKVNVPKVQLAIYPNPVIDVLKVQGLDNNAQVEITDIIGRVIINTQTMSGEINVSKLANGVYSIHLTDASGVRSAKFLKE